MSPQNLTEIIKNYKPAKARAAYLRSQMEMLERFLRKCSSEMIEDQVSMSQAITGMPHGSSVGDPVSRLALDIASGKVSVFVEQIQQEMKEVNAELAAVYLKIRVVDTVMDGLNDRERCLIELKVMDGFTWAEILSKMNRQYGNSYSKRSLQRLYDRAFDKALEIAK